MNELDELEQELDGESMMDVGPTAAGPKEDLSEVNLPTVPTGGLKQMTLMLMKMQLLRHWRQQWRRFEPELHK